MKKHIDDKAKKIGVEIADYWYRHLHGQIPPIFQKQNIAGYTRELINSHFQRTDISEEEQWIIDRIKNDWENRRVNESGEVEISLYEAGVIIDIINSK